MLIETCTELKHKTTNYTKPYLKKTNNHARYRVHLTYIYF